MASDLHQTHSGAVNSEPVSTSIRNNFAATPSSPELSFAKPGSGRTQLISRLSKDHLAILAFYPLTAVLGTLVQILSPPGPSYFSNKRNILNLVFVKHGGWAWVTALALLHLFGSPAIGGLAVTANKRVVGLRFVAITFWWVLFSQWCFGLPLMDKVFVLTGGGCSPVAGTASASAATLVTATSSAACRSQGGAWVGGIDPSGHMFLLSLSSLYIWFDILLPTLSSSSNNNSTVDGTADKKKTSYSLVTKLAFFFIAIYWWMILMTNVYSFHTTFERLTGITWSYLGIALIYFVSPNFPALRGILYE